MGAPSPELCNLWLARAFNAQDVEVAGDRRVMRDDVHVRFHADVGRHRLADALGASGRLGSAMDLIDLNDRSIRMVHGGGGFDVLRVEGACEPEVAEFG